MSKIVNVFVPEEVGTDDDEIVLANWFFDDGDEVSADTEICQLMVTKVSFEIDAPAAGRLRHIVKAEDTVKRGDVIARIEVI